MYMRLFERLEYGTYETIKLNYYGFIWEVEGQPVKSGFIEDEEETAAMLIDEGFEEVE